MLLVSMLNHAIILALKLVYMVTFFSSIFKKMVKIDSLTLIHDRKLGNLLEK